MKSSFFILFAFLSMTVFAVENTNDIADETSQHCILDSQASLDNEEVKLLYERGWIVRESDTMEYGRYIRTGDRRWYRFSTDLEKSRVPQAIIQIAQKNNGINLLKWFNDRGYDQALVAGNFKKTITLRYNFLDRTEIVSKTRTRLLGIESITKGGGIYIPESRILNDFIENIPDCNLDLYKQ
jgi:hypothetical protein